MHYVIQTGILFSEENQPIVQLKGAFSGQEKTICTPDGTVLMRTMICSLPARSEYGGDVRSHEYVLTGADGARLAWASPDYAAGSDPSVTGWPVCRMPRVDHAAVRLHGKEYRLNFQNSQNYTLTDASGTVVLQIIHRGLMGGWNVETCEAFLPGELCGIFAFCRYLEQENEMMVV